MNSFFLFCIILGTACITTCLADSDHLQDVCPTAATTDKQAIFINGFPCKHPANITPSEFKSSKLKLAGDTDNFLRSSTTIVTAADFPGLNTLGLSVARIDLEVDGLVMPHSHPRAAEMFYVSKGTVIAGFIDTTNKLFQMFLKEGEVFVFPRGLLHFCLNAGYEAAIVFSVHNSQNPGVVKFAGAMFDIDEELINNVKKKIKYASALGVNGFENVTLARF